MKDIVEKPAIIVSSVDERRLTALATDGLARFPEVAGELLAEMERAQIQAAQAMPATVVTMGSAVVFRSDDGRTRRVALVFPGQADIGQGRISILTPIGTALIGLSVGQSMTWATRDGRRRELTVLSVEPPVDEAAAYT